MYLYNKYLSAIYYAIKCLFRLPRLFTNRIYVKLSPNLKILKVYNKYSQVFNVQNEEINASTQPFKVI